ncbi:MAG: mannan endo,4-beta-mannosidase, partial [Actinomycetota bacterium]|jgi:mannan endo-1,4-beta-mannosidase|nr:mannan endo,4-beta-mannosidase [Actinomycetota bacterium]
MIDAPDCGTALDAFNSISSQLINHDPNHNLLLSAHAYWAAPQFDPWLALTLALGAQIPVVFGEIANKQKENGDECYWDLDGTNVGHAPKIQFKYQDLLATLANSDIGWLAWCWWRDKCHAREMTRDGTFAGLTPYGSDLVHNATYGLKTHAQRTPTLP